MPSRANAVLDPGLDARRFGDSDRRCGVVLVGVNASNAFTIRVGGGVELEARWDGLTNPDHCVVFAHPSPLHGGTMTSPLMVGVTRHLVEAKFCVLRFNFRGVGRSTGVSTSGTDEMDDVAAAVETASLAFPDLPLAVAGWSFGAATTLGWEARDRSALPYAGIAPPVASANTQRLPEPAALLPARRSFIVGDRDQFVTVEELSGYADSIGAELRVVAGSDHFFHFRYERLAALTAESLTTT